jgi:hypothetical protein
VRVLAAITVGMKIMVYCGVTRCILQASTTISAEPAVFIFSTEQYKHMERANKNVGWKERTRAMSRAIGISVQVKG